MAIIAFPSILNERLTDAGAQALVDIFDKVGQENKNAALELTEERFEKRMIQLDAKIDAVESRIEAKISSVKSELEVQIGSVKSELEVQIGIVKSELEVQISSVKSELEVRIERSQANIIKWMFIFWMGQMGTMIAILLTFFKK